MASLAGKVVLITGASSGIGEGTALHFASLGSKLALNGRRLEPLQAVAEKCCKAGLAESDVYIAQGDVALEEDSNRILSGTVDKFGHLDVLVNNVGIGIKGASILDSTLEEYDHIMNINLRSTVMMTQKAIPHLLKTQGNIVNVSSISGLRPVAACTFYSMTKAAMDQFTQCCAAELAPKKIRVNSVNPGLVETKFHQHSGLDEESIAKIRSAGEKLHPLGRNGQPDDVAKAIAFLASDEASFITGALLPIDGGRICVFPRGT